MTPPVTADLVLSLRADVQGNFVEGVRPQRWGDESGDDNHGSRSPEGSRPIFRQGGTGGRASLEFGGSHSYVLPDGVLPTGDGDYTIYVAVTVETSSAADIVFQGDAGSTKTSLFFRPHTSGRLNTGWFGSNLFSANGVVPQGTVFIASTRYDGSGRAQWLDGVAAGSDTETGRNTGAGGARVGAENFGGADQTFFVGDMHEILVYDAAHDTATRESIEAYLAAKWQDARAIETPTVVSPAENEDLSAAAQGVLWTPPEANESNVLVTFGFATDIHNADLDPLLGGSTGDRYYRDVPDKMAEVIERWQAFGVDFAMASEIVDGTGASKAQHQQWLDELEAIYAGVGVDRYYTLGNHDLDQISKAEFFAATGMSEGYYSFDHGGVHFVVLDACFRTDDDEDPYDSGNFNFENTWIPPDERTWLTNDLAATALPVIVFTHQSLDSHSTSNLQVDNASAVRSILEGAGNVIAAFSGHVHENQFNYISGIPYIAFEAVVDGQSPDNAYGVVQIREDESIEIHGFRSQHPYLPSLILPSYAHGRYRLQGAGSWTNIAGFADVTEPGKFFWDLSGFAPGTYEMQVGRTTDDEATVQWGSTRTFTVEGGAVVASAPARGRIHLGIGLGL